MKKPFLAESMAKPTAAIVSLSPSLQRPPPLLRFNWYCPDSCCSLVRFGVWGDGIGLPRRLHHGSTFRHCFFGPSRPFSTEELVRIFHQPLEPPWRPPWPPPFSQLSSSYYTHFTPPIHLIITTMSRRPSKAYVMPGRILGVTPETVCASPQRKSRGNSKRSAGVEVQRSILRPSAPAFKPASSIPAAPAPPLAPGAIEAAKKAAKNQRSRSASKTSSRTYSAAAAASTAESGSTATDPPADAAASSLRSRGVRVDESRNEWKRFEENSVDDDDEWEDVSLELDDRKPAARRDSDVEMESTEGDMDVEEHIGDVDVDAAQKADESHDGDNNRDGDDGGSRSGDSTSSVDSDEPEEMYADLAGFKRGKIRFTLDKQKNFYWADYSRLNVKEMKALLHQRDQGTSGTKATLTRRLESGDRTRLTKLTALGRMDKLQSHADNMASLLEMKSSGDRSRSRERGRSAEPRPGGARDPSPSGQKGQKSDPIEVEEASDPDETMSTSSSAEELFPNQQNKPASPVKKKKKKSASPADNNSPSPPATIATKSTASTTQSTVSSLNTPATVVSSTSGRLLNTRPRRDTTTDGVANFVSITCPPCKKSGEPASACHATLSKAFSVLKKNDPDLAWYPIWDPEPGCEPIPPLTDPKKFPSDLDAAQVYVRITNPWDLQKVKPGELDRKTGELKKQKALYVAVLIGSKFSLDHVLEISYPSLSAFGCQIRRKDVDALESTTLYAFVGLPNEWDSFSLTAKLKQDLEKHEEWMQGNVKSGYNAMQHAGTEFPPVIVRRTQVRLPEGKDILGAEENEVVQYAYSLRKFNVIEVSSCDRSRVDGVLSDFLLRGKLKSYSSDCGLLALNVNSGSDRMKRLEFYRGIFSQMNYEHVHSVMFFDGITVGDWPARGEMDTKYHDSRQAFKNTCIRRELLDIRRTDGKKVFLGAIDGSGDNKGRLQVYFYNDDENEVFVAGMCGNLPMYLYAYLQNVKGYSERSILAILAGCSESYRLGARDAKWDSEKRAITPLTQLGRSDFTARMAERNMTVLLPELMQCYSKQASSKRTFSDAAKEEVAKGLRFKDKPGYNPTAADAASVLTETSKATSGAASNRSVTTHDIQCQLPELRTELNRLRQRLLELSPNDNLFDHPLMAASTVDELSEHSSASAQLNAFYKDTQQCILLLKTRISELSQDGRPPPESGSAAPSPSDEEESRVAAQGE